MEIANLSRVSKELQEKVLEELGILGQAQQYMLKGYYARICWKTLGHHKVKGNNKRLKEHKVKPYFCAAY